MGRFEKLSEKIMPYKIKSIISNNYIDIMIINCGKYFEVQRINYKHETIFKKEVKKEIIEVVLLSVNYLILVIYEDSKYEIINIDKNEVIYSSIFDKMKISFDKFNFVAPYQNNNTNLNSITNNNNLNIPSLNINSFSKFDVSKISFLESIENFTKNNFYTLDKQNSKIYIFQNVINPLCEINFNLSDNNSDIIKMFPFEQDSVICITKKKFFNKLNYYFYYLNPSKKLTNEIHDSLYKLHFSVCLIDYIKNILSLLQKLINKTKIILFDKYLDNNNLTFKVDKTNEDKYQKNLQNDFLNNIFFGEISLRLSNMFKEDFFQEGVLNKLEDNIHFNIKNIENIIIGHLKPALNRIEIYLKLNDFNDEYNFINIFSSIDELLKNLINTSSDYRNFIGWLYTMSVQYNSKDNNSNNNQNKKNNLEKIYIENESLISFVMDEKYLMKNTMVLFDEELNNNKDNKNNIINNNINYSSNDMNKNIFSKKFLEQNNINFNSKINIQNKTNSINNINNNDSKYLVSKLDTLKSLINAEIEKKYKLLSDDSQNLPQIFIKLADIENEIKDFYILSNESNEFIFYFKTKENLKNILYIIALSSNSQCKLAKINFSYEMNIKIVDFKITNKNELFLLVKTPIKNEIELKEFKFTLICSDLSNYNFYDVKYGNDKIINLNLGEYNGCEDIKIDDHADVECSDDAFLVLTGKGFLSLVDNSLNKIIVIDIVQDKL